MGFMNRKIVVTSGKGGVGKTTLCVLLGAALAKTNKKVVILDLDFSLNNLDVVAGVENKIVYDLADVVEGRCRVKQAIVEVDRNLSVIQSDRSFSDKVTGQNVRLLIDGLADKYDFVLLDCPAGIEGGFTRAVSAADEAIVVVNPSLSSLRDADKVVNILMQYKLGGIYAVVNKVRGDLSLKGLALGVNEIEDILKLPVIGAIPDDDGILLSTGTDVGGIRAARSIKMLSAYLLKGSGKVYDCERSFKGPFGRIRAILNKRA